jgi:hypothetical protein
LRHDAGVKKAIKSQDIGNKGVIAMDMRFLAAIMLVLFLIYILVELGWRGGDPNHKDHNPSGGYGGGPS